MEPETLRRLFEPFYTTKKNCTGLGMAIARKIAELHRGELKIKSKLGSGRWRRYACPGIERADNTLGIEKRLSF